MQVRLSHYRTCRLRCRFPVAVGSALFAVRRSHRARLRWLPFTPHFTAFARLPFTRLRLLLRLRLLPCHRTRGSPAAVTPRLGYTRMPHTYARSPFGWLHAVTLHPTFTPLVVRTPRCTVLHTVPFAFLRLPVRHGCCSYIATHGYHTTAWFSLRTHTGYRLRLRFACGSGSLRLPVRHARSCVCRVLLPFTFCTPATVPPSVLRWFAAILPPLWLLRSSVMRWVGYAVTVTVTLRTLPVRSTTCAHAVLPPPFTTWLDSGCGLLPAPRLHTAFTLRLPYTPFPVVTHYCVLVHVHVYTCVYTPHRYLYLPVVALIWITVLPAVPAVRGSLPVLQVTPHVCRTRCAVLPRAHAFPFAFCTTRLPLFFTDFTFVRSLVTFGFTFAFVCVYVTACLRTFLAGLPRVLYVCYRGLRTRTFFTVALLDFYATLRLRLQFVQFFWFDYDSV